MNTVGKSERKTQERIISRFEKQLNYEYLGNWIDRENSNVEEEYLGTYLQSQGYADNLITAAIHKITDAAQSYTGSLYDRNHEVYKMLRYGVDYKPDESSNTEKIFLINWKEPLRNHFAIAEEVSVKGENTKRPDLVIYINGVNSRIKLNSIPAFF